MKRKLIIREKIILAIFLVAMIPMITGIGSGYFLGVELLKTATINKYQNTAAPQAAGAGDMGDLVVLYNSLVRKLSVQLLLLMGVLLTIMVVVGIKVSRMLTFPIEKLREGVERISKGDLDPRVVIRTGDELEVLADSFNRMVEDLGRTTTSIDLLNAEMSARHTAERALAESEGKIRALLDQAFQFISLISTEGVLLDANRTALDLVGADPQSVLNKPFWETPWWTHSPELQAKLKNAIAEAAAGNVVRLEVTHKDKDGSLHDVDFSLKPVRDDNGRIIFLIPEGRDITDRKKMEEKLRVAYEQLKQFQSQLIQAAKMGAVGQLAAGAAHEIDNPMSVISGESEMLLLEARDERTKDALKTIMEQIRRVDSIIERLLSFSRKKEPVLQALRINEIIEESARLAGYQAKTQSVEMVKDLAKELPKIMADENQLKEVFVNIILNAAQSMEDKGTLRIRTYEEGVVTDDNGNRRSSVVAEFRDTGKGMDQEILNGLFEPFFSTKDRGMGLGLFVCYGIIKSYGGNIEVHSKPGEGSTFTVKLPALG
ncbi:MAG: ATP-binding protein [Candidatus Omnitrophica bacterium]|nr:ATP-binding protein [Candidatus Omnitrophota bacterium]